jgi:ABC-type thiamin/hydroxymethylpyrimidine transport system permease subunit
VTVRHDPRSSGKSNYSPLRIARLVMTILFSYSSYPLRLLGYVGFCIAGASFVYGFIYLIHGAFGSSHVRGWTTLVVLLSIFNGFIIAMLSMLGEYVVRTLSAVSDKDSYHVIERVSG